MEHFNRLRRSSFGLGTSSSSPPSTTVATTTTTTFNTSAAKSAALVGNRSSSGGVGGSSSSINSSGMRSATRSSTGAGGGGGGCGEPMIVVETDHCDDPAVELASLRSSSTQRDSLDIDSPVNPYLLSPWRDARETRKHSLPTQQVTDGITASQVRRLSERGGEGSGPTPKEAEFLATLSQAPAPSGRRHSVVTISKLPQTVFGRGRRESVAAFSGGAAGSRGSLFSSRRDSGSSAITVAGGSGIAGGGPPATDPVGSIHNLQLDIMDDIVQSRKARMKLWNTSSEKVCEVHTLDEAGTATTQSPKRYTNRRYSDFVGSQLAPIPQNRRASENFVSPAAAAAVAASVATPVATPSAGGGGASMAANFLKKSGIVVTKNDLLSLMSSLTSSANEIHRIDYEDEPVPPPLAGFTCKTAPPKAAKRADDASPPAAAGAGAATGTQATLLIPEAAGMQRSNRSNSFDVSILHNCKQIIAGGSGGAAAATPADKNAAALSGWFEKRHQPMARKKSLRPQAAAAATVSFSKEVLERFKDKEERGGGGGGGSGGSGVAGPSSSTAATASKSSSKSRGKLRWDNKASFVDPHIIGNAIEGFLRKSSGRSGSRESRARKSAAAGGSGSGSARATFWFSKSAEDDSKDSCDTSLCATLKDLFVK